MKLRFFCLLFCVHIIAFSQKSPTVSHLTAGEIVRENLKLVDSSGAVLTFRIPSDSCFLFYRFRGNNWLLDNKDSIEIVERIALGIQKSHSSFKNLRVMCYAYNKDNYINANNKPLLKNSSELSMGFYLQNDKASRILNSDKLTLISNKGKVLASSPTIAGFKYTHKREQHRLRGKLLTEKNGIKTPLINAKVYMSS